MGLTSAPFSLLRLCLPLPPPLGALVGDPHSEIDIARPKRVLDLGREIVIVPVTRLAPHPSFADNSQTDEIIYHALHLVPIERQPRTSVPLATIRVPSGVAAQICALQFQQAVDRRVKRLNHVGDVEEDVWGRADFHTSFTFWLPKPKKRDGLYVSVFLGCSPYLFS
jgi:hypothetical protein